MNGPKVMFYLPILGGIPVTETVTNAWLVMALITGLIFYFTRNLQKVPSKKQVLVEKMVTTVYDMVEQTMGRDKLGFAPYIGTLFMFSLFSSMLSLFTLRPPTADVNTTLCWALITFFMVQINAIRKKKIGGWLHGFIEPIPIIVPMNIISEFANPVSLTFRHFGNIAAGQVITTLMYSGLAAASTFFFSWLPIPILQLGLPAVLSIYFDLFTAGMQAFIFSMLTMVFVAMAMD